MDLPVTLLCREPSNKKDERMEQALYCALIEGYTDATAELSRFITKLYQQNNPDVYLVSKVLRPLRAKQSERYNQLVAELNGNPDPDYSYRTPFWLKASMTQPGTDIKKRSYERYQMVWLLSHGYSISDLIDELNNVWKNDDQREEVSPGIAFNIFEEVGFRSEIWGSYEEFLDNEYRNKTYMKGLLNGEEYSLYIRDLDEDDNME